ncbi:hypothetical protein HO594_09560 [Streptococcus suis]|nr:hypothetical protein [Streptococcus suis]
MSQYHSNKSDFVKKPYLSSQKSLVERMLREIDDAGATVQSEGLSHLYVAQGEATLGAGKTSHKFVEATTRISTMLTSASKIHKEVLQNIDSKLVKGLDSAFESLNNVNGKDNQYKTKNTYSRTQTYNTNYTTANGNYAQTVTRQDHYTLDEILDGEKTPLQVVKDTYSNRVKQVRSQITASDTLSDEQIKEIESMSDEEVLETFYPRLTADNEYQKIKASTYQEVHKDELSKVDVGVNIFAGIAMIAGVALAPVTGGASLYVSYVAGTYLAGSSAYSAITGNTLITGDRLSPVERTFAGVEAVTTVLSLGSTAVASGGLKAGSQATKVITTLGKVADKTDDLMEYGQLLYGVGTGDAQSALANFAIGKSVDLGAEAVFGKIAKHLPDQTPQVQLNARQGQDFVDLQTVEFGKIASKVENNITIKMTVDGVEQKIRVDAIGFDEAGNIRIQEYTTAQSGLKSSRQNLLEDLSKYGGTIVGAGKGDFVGGVEIPKGTQIDVVSQKTGNVTIGQTINPQHEIIDFNNTDFDVSLIKDRLKTEPGTAFFWSGRTDGIGGMDVAKDIAKSRGGVTLESTIEDTNIIMKDWNIEDTSTIDAWERASDVYAEQVTGEVRAVVGSELREGNIWENIELPRLKNNPKVTKITTIDPKTGLETVIFERGQ